MSRSKQQYSHADEITERGTHEELIAKGGTYKELYALQFRDNDTFE